MSDREHTIEIETKLRSDCTEMLRAGCDVFKCSRPTATGIADPAVFQVPGRDTSSGQCFAARDDVFKVYFARQNPPWITMATGCGPALSGMRSSPN